MRKLVLAAAVLACGMGAVHAADLRDAWLDASQRHPDMVAAKATRAAGEARRLQASRLWNPTVSAQAATGAMGSTTSAQGAAFSMPGAPPTAGVGFETSVRSGPGVRWGLEARMPLYNPALRVQERQLFLSADMAELQAASAQQALMLKTAEQYFAAVLAQQHHALLQRQQEADHLALKEAQDRFALGDAPVTDVREAQARALATAALVEAAQVEVQVAWQALAQTTGWNPAQLPRLHLPRAVGNDTTAAQGGEALAPLPQWLDLAERENLRVRTLAQALALAEQEAAKAIQAGSTKVDLVAQAGADHLSGSGRWGSTSNSTRHYLVGVQLQVPLYTGGQPQARQQEWLHLQEKAQAELDAGRWAVTQQVRATWLQLQAGTSRARALESARAAAQARLEATQLGRQVGDRTILELLQAHNDAVQSQLQVMEYRARMALERLQLLALTGQLDEAALQAATDAAPTVEAPAP